MKLPKPFLKKSTCLILIIIVFSGLFLVNVGEAGAAPGILKEIAQDLLVGLFSVLLHIAQAFAGFVANIFKGIVYFGFQEMSTVKVGWTISRDIVNMFFILGLIAIAFATILKIETYGIKALLPRLIIMALLINFSYVICGLIIDATQIAATYFVEQIETDDIGLAILDRLQVIDAVRGMEGARVPITDYDTDMVVILTTAFSALVLFLAGFVMLVGAILLFIRVGALWALIILSPFAWFFSIFPAGALKKYTSQWWDNFLKYAFFAPIYIFFIFLVLKIAETEVLKSAKIATGETVVGLASLTLVPMFGDLNLLFKYVFLIILLFGAPTIAMSMGIKGAGAAQHFVKGALKTTAGLPFRAARGLQKAAATMAPPAWMEKTPLTRPLAKLVRGVQKTAAYTSLDFWKKAMAERKKERMRKARIGYTIGKQQDILNRLFSFGSEKTSFAEQAEQFEVEERKKEVGAETKRVGSHLRAKLKDATKQKDILTYKACMELLQEQGDTNDAMIFDEMFDEFKYDEKLALPKFKNEDGTMKNVNDPKRRRFSNLGFKHGVIGQMRKMGLSDKQIAPFLGKLQEIGLQSGYYGMYGQVETDKKGNTVITDDATQIKIASAKFKVMTPRVRTSKWHGTAIGQQGVDANGQYEFVESDDVDDAMLATMTDEDVEQTSMQYLRPDARKVAGEAHKAGALSKISKQADDFGKKCVGKKEEPKKEEPKLVPGTEAEFKKAKKEYKGK